MNGIWSYIIGIAFSIMALIGAMMLGTAISNKNKRGIIIGSLLLTPVVVLFASVGILVLIWS